MATVKIITSDNQMFEIPKEHAILSSTIRNMLEDLEDDSVVPVPNVDAKTFSKVAQFCKFRCEEHTEKETNEFEKEFLDMETSDVFNVILAANYLNIEKLLDASCRSVADMIKGKTPEEIRETFNIQNDFTPEEEEQVRRENMWAFE